LFVFQTFFTEKGGEKLKTFSLFCEFEVKIQPVILLLFLGRSSIGLEQACLRSGKLDNLGERLGTNSRKQGMCSGANFSTISIQIASVQTENFFIRY
jgi:hypothetical protein